LIFHKEAWLLTRYKNAAEVLPDHLLQRLQEYAAGQVLYVPTPLRRLGWGERSGAREELRRRNEAIRARRSAGASIDLLMAEYHLGYDSIRKIISGATETEQGACRHDRESGKNQLIGSRA
jgi:Mor family transcriptional regulator